MSMRIAVIIAAVAASIPLPAALAVEPDFHAPTLPTRAPSALIEPVALRTPSFPSSPKPVAGVAPDPPEALDRASILEPQIARDEIAPVFDALSKRWSHKIGSGETLDAVLADAGLAAGQRAEISLALGAEYDLRRLRPGYEVFFTFALDGRLREVALRVEQGIRIEVAVDEKLAVRVLSPEPDIVLLAGETVIEHSLFVALEKAEIPARFAVDLAQVLGGIVDFRRDITGGETLRLLWREARVGKEIVGQPALSFAAFETFEALYELVWPEGEAGRAMIYLDGELVRVFAQPVDGARISSVFGRRRHPVHGDMRMHTGVDFAAAHGTPVKATASGRVVFAGWRRGYGRMIELSHGTGTRTRYAHLSKVAKGIKKGRRVTAGATIGRVGATGTATGPNLHYEVLVDGHPTDPLSEDRLALAAEHEALSAEALLRLGEARALAEARLSNPVMSDSEGSDS